MLDKIPTYRIDESALRSKLLNYKVEVNATECSAIEQEVAAMRFKKTITLPKINLRVLVPALLIVALTTVVCFNLDTIKDLFSAAPETKIENKVSLPVTQPVVTTQTVAAIPVPTPTLENIIPATDHALLLKKQDSILAANKKADSLKLAAAKKAIPVIAPPPSDSVAKNNTISKQDTAVQKTDTPVKKKKKRRRRSAALEDIKQSTLQENSADDDVVVPQ